MQSFLNCSVMLNESQYALFGLNSTGMPFFPKRTLPLLFSGLICHDRSLYRDEVP